MATKQLNNVKILFDTNIGADKVLMKGEIGFDENYSLKVGDGSSAFETLPAFLSTSDTLILSGGDSIDNINYIAEEDVDALLEKEV